MRTLTARSLADLARATPWAAHSAGMPELLTGTVTFFFSDIEGSTRLLSATGDRWPALLGRHQQLLRAAFEANEGSEVGTEGDSFFAVFPTAQAAVAAAVAAQKA